MSPPATARRPPSKAAGLLYGLGFDGVFHLATWALVLAGSVATLVAWRQGRLAPSWSFHFGLVIAGWGIFNLVEGVVDHQILGVHHVRDALGAPLSWDVGFLALGCLLVVAGWGLHRRGAREVLAEASTPPSVVGGH